MLAFLVGDQSRLEIKAHVVAKGRAFSLPLHFDQAGVGEGEGLAGQIGQATLVQPDGVHVEVRRGWHLSRRFDQALDEGVAVAQVRDVICPHSPFFILHPPFFCCQCVVEGEALIGRYAQARRQVVGQEHLVHPIGWRLDDSACLPAIVQHKVR